MKACPVLYALCEKTEQELERLQGLGVIVLVESSEWAAPVVPVVKSDGSVHICGNFRLKSRIRRPLCFAALKGGQSQAELENVIYPPWMLSWGNWKLPDCGSREVNVYFLLLLWSTWDLAENTSRLG